ncbi:membrane protein [Escherichia coli O111:NM str. 2010C-4592]|nr:putative membrane protein [Escherichia coli OK1180]EHW16532.1 putative membrane protein [Escherichia coli DEC8C]EYX78417.1 membrane protein [Escherichia coli O111:NM str. 2011C-3632]EYZ05283.1 membrane protein [Escherichia coli O111:NM str. 2010C-4592]EZQ22373.1 membrane protein [Escherichia coli O111:H8 str. 2009EL-2169]
MNEIGLFYVFFFGALALLELGIELFAVLMFFVTMLGKF